MGHFLLVWGMHKLFAASCCDSGGQMRDGRGRNRERQREGKRVRKSELFSQTWSLSLTKLQAPKPQCRLVPKGTTLQKLTSKPGWSQREEDNFTETNKPHNLTVTLKNSNFLWIKLTNQLDFNFCITVKSIFDKVKWCLMQLQFQYEMFSSIATIQEAKRALRPKTQSAVVQLLIYNSLSLMSVPLSLWSMSHWVTRVGGSQLTHINPLIRVNTHLCDE